MSAMLLYLAVTAGSWIVTRISLRIAYMLGGAAGDVGYIVAGRSRRAVLKNLSIVLGLPLKSTRLGRTARLAFRNNGCNWVDSLRLGSATRDEINNRVTVDRWDLVEAAAVEQKGVILLGMHLGNIDVVGQIVAARGYEVTVPVEPMRPAALFRRTQRLRQSLGIHTVDASRAGRELLRALGRGQFVGIMVDRNLGAGGIEVEFFGRRTVVSRGPAWLVSRSDAPVLIGAGFRGEDGRFQATVATVSVQRTGQPRADEQANAQIIIHAAEEHIRRHPEQWAMFVPIWDT